MQLAEKILHWFHRLPHFNYQFKPISDSFNLEVNEPYLQSLVVLCGASLLLALILLLLIVIVWICQCCLKKSDSVHSRRHIRRLSSSLFLISVVCFSLLGACLFGNELISKNVGLAATTNLGDFNNDIEIASEQAQRLNSTQLDMSQRLEELTNLIETKSKATPTINQTMMREVDALLTEVSDKVDEVEKNLVKIGATFSDVHFLQKTKTVGERIEFERWISMLTLISIMVVVLFAGVICFCRQSKKGAILFSGAGIVIFLLNWVLFASVFPATVAFADFCLSGRSFLEARMQSEMIDTLEFYRNCVDLGDRSNVPPKIPVTEIINSYAKIEESQQKLSPLLIALFNNSQEVESATRQVSYQISKSHKSIGALESLLSCANVHEDVLVMYTSFCTTGFIGSVVMTVALFFLGIFLTVLLILVSRSWHIFVRLPSDYVEVGEDDHFSPRGQDSMPDNVYDTNIFNPRARQITSNSGGMMVKHSTTLVQDGGGVSNAQNSPSTPLIQQQPQDSHSSTSATTAMTRNLWLSRNNPTAPPSSMNRFN